MRIASVMLDYDGTIAPLGVLRGESRVFRSVERELRRISGRTPVCIVTAKDYDFVHPRSRFAAGWGCVSGLDVRLADGRTTTRKKLRSLDPALRLAESSALSGTYIELKRGPSGELLGVGFDWSEVPEVKELLTSKLRSLAKSGMILSWDGHSTYADAYSAVPDKGQATILLKNLLGVKGAVMFIGDSAADNSAFQRAEVSVGVTHGQSMDDLGCEYIVEQARLAEFLRSLSDRGMDFMPSMPWVRRKEGLRSRESGGHHVPDEPHQGAGAGRPADGKGTQASGS
jgi:hypothetical protein